MREQLLVTQTEVQQSKHRCDALRDDNDQLKVSLVFDVRCSID